MVDVSIIVPCFNEEETIRLLLQSIYEQTYPIEKIEVIISDGLSRDKTREVIQKFILDRPKLSIQVVDNPARTIPSALNIAIRESKGTYIIRLDAHSIPAKDYVDLCVKDLSEHKGDNVGGVWDIRPQNNSVIARSIAIGASHKLGVGDARYRYTNQASYVDTVPFGAFRRELFEKIGQFDESLLTNEDYEFNIRIKKNGGQIWLNPAIRAVYFSRPDIGSLSKQYWRYGTWKWRMLKRNLGTIKWRQFLPPAFVVSLGLWILLGFLHPIFWIGLLLEIVFYLGAIFTAAFLESIKVKDLRVSLGITLAIMTMHISWGTGFLWSMVKSIFVRDLFK